MQVKATNVRKARTHMVNSFADMVDPFRVTCWHYTSVRIPIHEPAPQRHEQNSQIQPRRPVRDVVEIVLNTLAKRGIAAPAVDLGPTGDARFHRVTRVVAGDRLDELADEHRPLRP